MSLKVLGAIREYTKEFSNVSAFESWYLKHKETVDAETTHILNKKYHIPGYRITRIQGEIQLKPEAWVGKTSKATSSTSTEFMEVIRSLEERIGKLETLVTELISRYNSMLEE